MQLELKHLAPYLPYELKILDRVTDREKNTKVMNTAHGISEPWIGINSLLLHTTEVYTPILRPLSDLTKENYKEELYAYFEQKGIDIKLSEYDSGNNNSEYITLVITYRLMGEVFTDILINRGSTENTPRHFFDWLCKNHFDVFNLIDNNLAINKNDIK